jgi:U3 small nucleolar RNA-associated protein 18
MPVWLGPTKPLGANANRERDVRPADAEELALEAQLFGDLVDDDDDDHGGGDGGTARAQLGSEADAIGDFAIRDVVGSAGLLGAGEEDREQDEQNEEQGSGSDDDDDGAEGESEGEDEDEGGRSAVAVATEDGRKRAWVDEDDERQLIDLTAVSRLRKLRRSEGEKLVRGADFAQRLREQHRRLHPATSWAERGTGGGGREASDLRGRWADTDSEDEEKEEGEEEEEAEDEEVFAAVTRRAGAALTVARRPRRLGSDELGVKRMADANVAGRSACVVQCTEFHRNGQLLLTAGFDQTARFFSIDGERNPLMQQVYIKNMPIHTAAFSADGLSVVMSGRRRYYYIYDLQRSQVVRVPGIVGRDEKSLEKFTLSPDGKWIAFMGDGGYIILVSMQTKQWVANLKMEGAVRALAFSADGQTLLSAGTAGEIFHWDLRTRRCRCRHYDMGMSPTTALSVAPTGGRFAVGSRSGCVHAYDFAAVEATCSGGSGAGRNPVPAAVVQSLTTPIDRVRYNHDGQLLAISSREKKDAVRLVHVPSYRTYSNWPTSRTPLKYASSLAFSPRSGYFACGNDKGTVLLYSLSHYTSA